MEASQEHTPSAPSQQAQKHPVAVTVPLSGTLGSPHSTADLFTTLLSSIPYFAYSLWVIPTLLLRRSLFRN
jgi:hypothetical protein